MQGPRGVHRQWQALGSLTVRVWVDSGPSEVGGRVSETWTGTQEKR